MSFAYWLTVYLIQEYGILIPLTKPRSTVRCNLMFKISPTCKKRHGATWQPCRTPLSMLKPYVASPLVATSIVALFKGILTISTKIGLRPSLCISVNRKFHDTQVYPLEKSNFNSNSGWCDISIQFTVSWLKTMLSKMCLRRKIKTSLIWAYDLHKSRLYSLLE